ncbi:transglutaminase TgpA family protein [Paraliomyxa miuraensis]|uniref:transglutaminase TgpA family protein n=1 Tax=Paraliomyxa miuraensis TaxID=376150 RepID=UPI002251B2FD|nr:DUF3488 and transglutaminase-like domain-containing protein [Paraliomyxa miuraensis]MCX4243254.1 DUF3488 and transglutaminase-like domain-containing protein [Paraliomyxa miuraensis]
MSEPLPMTPLRRLRDRLSLAQAALAVAAVALAGGVGTPSLLAVSGLVAVAWWRPLPAIPSVSAQRAWTALVLAALLATFARVVLRAELIDAGVDFLLLLVAQRMFNRQRAREHAQLLLLGSLLMVVGAVINTELSYPVLLGAYLVTAIMGLCANNLMAEGERLGARVMPVIDREGHARRRSLWRSAGGVAVVAGLGALLTFLLFPRFGVGVLLRGRLASEVRSGFSEDLELGGFGTIKSDATVVMRIRPDEPPGSDRTTWHLRGSSFDHYEGGRWQHGREGTPGPLQIAQGYRSVTDQGRPRLVRSPTRELSARPIPGFAASTRIAQATIVLEDIGAEVLLVPSDPVAVRVLSRGSFEALPIPVGARNHEVRLIRPPGPVQYRVVWRPDEPTRDELAAAGHPVVPSALGAYLQRSASLDPEVGRLAQRLAADATTRLHVVDAIMGHLRGYEYTLEQRVSDRVRDGADPIVGFLLDTRAGHCEYFATAMVVLLREVGVPARIVNGYYGAHHNAVGEFYAVRQADAHSWVEVHFGPLGWVTFDPTPPSGRYAGDDAPWWPAATELIDALRNSYLEHVIDYDLGKQLAALERLGLRRGDRPLDGMSRGWWLAALGLGLGLWLWRRAAARRRARVRPETRWMLAVLARVQQLGVPCEPHQSPQRIAERVRGAGIMGADELQRFVQRYEVVRFGPAPTNQARHDLRRLARATLRSLQHPRAGHDGTSSSGSM